MSVPIFVTFFYVLHMALVFAQEEAFDCSGEDSWGVNVLSGSWKCLRKGQGKKGGGRDSTFWTEPVRRQEGMEEHGVF